MQEAHRQALAVLESCGPQLLALLTRLTLRPDVAEDLLQDLFLNLCRSRAFAEAENPGGYAWQAAIHLAFAWRRRQRSAIPAETASVTASADGPLARLIADEQLQLLMDAMEDLPQIYRDVLVMRYVQQEPYEALTGRFGRTPQQLRSVCHKAIRSLRKLVGAPRPQGKEESGAR